MLEVRDLVQDHYLDARQSGFDKDKWRGMVNEVLNSPLPDTQTAHRCGQPALHASDPPARQLDYAISCHLLPFHGGLSS